ncbi:hypothetical protein OWR29_44545 [Actinoplanes sp. Pm04-4]|uniref:Uncharacterized protein n=1 Tax=Paractinoplanes pyxinae TaxID=2997416 RepID=A0ABT4BF24_9ACTN|nr:hypothetical protein [Actinoplanes pyxinae]MCY1145114.1 hypothetical protein [Actinoplanes pyxinae]
MPLPVRPPAPPPLDEARRSPIDRIGRAASATIVRRIIGLQRSRDLSSPGR